MVIFFLSGLQGNFSVIHHFHLKISLSEVRAILKVTLLLSFIPLYPLLSLTPKREGGLLEWESWGGGLLRTLPTIDEDSSNDPHPPFPVKFSLKETVSENFTVKSVLLYLLSICFLP